MGILNSEQEELNYKQGQLIKKLRIEKGFGQVELSKASGISVAYISRIESGHITISDKSFNALAKALNVSVAYLKNEAGENKDDIARDDGYIDNNMYNKPQEKIIRERKPNEILLENSMTFLLKKIENDEKFVDVVLNIIRELDSFYDTRKMVVSNKNSQDDYEYTLSVERVALNIIIERIEETLRKDLGSIVYC